ncbi:MAG TPA: FAD-dependent oxidoreductase [Burkholderiales bacterium]|nr:FAD-dependent oxidoreductase [Burkholderiales bacterium]
MKRLVLLGGGHSHVEVVRRFGLRPLHDAQALLVSAEHQTAYSGMLPGYIAGHYAFSDCHIALEPLCDAADVRFRLGRARHIDTGRRLVHLEDGTTLDYDILSVDIGAVPDTDAVPGAHEYGVPVKPLSSFVSAWSGILASARRAGNPLTVVVVGGGAGGVELTLAVHRRLSELRAKGSATLSVHLLTDTSSILPDHSTATRRKLERILRERAIAVHTQNRVTAIDGTTVFSQHGVPLKADHVMITTGASGPRWLASTPLRIDTRRFVVVNAALQSVSHAEVFAAGDVASIEGYAIPKSGVYAVREGPVLAENLRRALASQPLVRYVPQRHTLALISTGNRYAVASWRGFALEGEWVWRWKDRIDRRFIARYQALAK